MLGPLVALRKRACKQHMNTTYLEVHHACWCTTNISQVPGTLFRSGSAKGRGVQRPKQPRVSVQAYLQARPPRRAPFPPPVQPPRELP